MTQSDAAVALRGLFIGPDSEGRLYFRRDSGQVVRESKANSSEVAKRRDDLLGAQFRFTWPDFPRGAVRL